MGGKDLRLGQDVSKGGPCISWRQVRNAKFRAQLRSAEPYFKGLVRNVCLTSLQLIPTSTLIVVWQRGLTHFLSLLTPFALVEKVCEGISGKEQLGAAPTLQSCRGLWGLWASWLQVKALSF